MAAAAAAVVVVVVQWRYDSDSSSNSAVRQVLRLDMGSELSVHVNPRADHGEAARTLKLGPHTPAQINLRLQEPTGTF